MDEELISRVQHLERENAELRHAALNPEVLENQLQQLMKPFRSAYHGPDTVAHLECFLIDGIISDLRTHCPDVFELFNMLGRVDRCDDPSNTTHITTKSDVSPHHSEMSFCQGSWHTAFADIYAHCSSHKQGKKNKINNTFKLYSTYTFIYMYMYMCTCKGLVKLIGVN